MRTAYFTRPGQPPRCLTQLAPAQTPDWNDTLTQLQALYEELLASQWLERWPPAPKPSPQELSAREITRDLAGWGPPSAGALRAGAPYGVEKLLILC